MPTTWDAEITARIGREVRRIREDRGWSGQHISDRTAQLGHSVGRATISELENGKRRNIAVAELLVLAASLEVAPGLLLFPEYPDGVTTALPGIETRAASAFEWLTGGDLVGREPETKTITVFPNSTEALVKLVREREELETAVTSLWQFIDPTRLNEKQAEDWDRYMAKFNSYQRRIYELGGTVTMDSEEFENGNG